MRTVAIIQARMGSTRFPGKVLADLAGRPVLSWVIRACREAAGVDAICIATSTSPKDDAIQNWFDAYGVGVYPQQLYLFRGSETDVLSRYYGAVLQTNAEVVLRITGDCPFIDPEVISGVIQLQKQTRADYVSNVDPRTYPDGLDVECFTKRALGFAHVEAVHPIDRDTVTYWIRRNQRRFLAESLINPIPGLEKERWVLDTQDDYKFCQEIASRHVKEHSGAPSQFQILDILDKAPELRKLNSHHIMNERFYDALAEEPVPVHSYRCSQHLLAVAEAHIPLGTQTFSKSKLQFPQPSPLFVTHGQGGLVWDVDGNEYVDLVSALLPSILGYRDPDVDAAIRRQLAKGISFSLATELEAELAETLCRLIPCAEMVRFGKNGTDATTAAVRVARAFTGRETVLIAGGYHGWGSWSCERNVGITCAEQSDTIRFKFGTRDFPEWCEDDEVAAVIVEPESDVAYLQFLRDWCSKHSALLIFDEVITGFRFHLGGAQSLWGITPDLACFGKAMANGMPISALVGRRDVMMKLAPPDNAFFSGTFFGETLSLAASLATIKKLERKSLLNKIYNTGIALERAVAERICRAGLQELILTHGIGALVRLHFKDPNQVAPGSVAALFRKEMLASGTLIIASHNICAAHTDGDMKRVLRSYDRALDVIADAVRKNDFKARLAGATVEPLVRA